MRSFAQASRNGIGVPSLILGALHPCLSLMGRLRSASCWGAGASLGLSLGLLAGMGLAPQLCRLCCQGRGWGHGSHTGLEFASGSSGQSPTDPSAGGGVGSPLWDTQLRAATEAATGVRSVAGRSWGQHQLPSSLGHTGQHRGPRAAAPAAPLWGTWGGTRWLHLRWPSRDHADRPGAVFRGGDQGGRLQLQALP